MQFLRLTTDRCKFEMLQLLAQTAPNRFSFVQQRREMSSSPGASVGKSEWMNECSFCATVWNQCVPLKPNVAEHNYHSVKDVCVQHTHLQTEWFKHHESFDMNQVKYLDSRGVKGGKETIENTKIIDEETCDCAQHCCWRGVAIIWTALSCFCCAHTLRHSVFIIKATSIQILISGFIRF